MRHLALAAILAFSLSMTLAGCGGGNGSDDKAKEVKREAMEPDVKEAAKETMTPEVKEVTEESMMEKPVIPAEAEEIVYAGGSGWGPAIFKHEQHANDYYDGDCYVCHDHYEENLSCSDCHTAGQDVEDLCDEDVNHGCIMKQCQECHVNHGSPAPDGTSCSHCHEIPPYAEATKVPGVLGTATIPEEMPISKSDPV